MCLCDTTRNNAMVYFCRNWRIGQEHFHQTDANHSWLRILRRRQTQLHQTRLSEHIYGDEFNDTCHGDVKNPLQRPVKRGMLFHYFLSPSSVFNLVFSHTPGVIINQTFIAKFMQQAFGNNYFDTFLNISNFHIYFLLCQTIADLSDSCVFICQDS